MHIEETHLAFKDRSMEIHLEDENQNLSQIHILKFPIEDMEDMHGSIRGCYCY